MRPLDIVTTEELLEELRRRMPRSVAIFNYVADGGQLRTGFSLGPDQMVNLGLAAQLYATLSHQSTQFQGISYGGVGPVRAPDGSAVMTFRRAYALVALPIALVATLALHGVIRGVDPAGATPLLFVLNLLVAGLSAAGVTYSIIRINRNHP